MEVPTRLAPFVELNYTVTRSHGYLILTKKTIPVNCLECAYLGKEFVEPSLELCGCGHLRL
jgi:hypothetical protein